MKLSLDDSVRGLTLDSYLCQIAASRGDAPAILGPDRGALSYEELWKQVQRTATALSRLGIKRGDKVGIVLPNGPDMAVCCLSVACAATCAPLNPAYTAAELGFYLSDLKPVALILAAGVESTAADVANRIGIPTLRLLPEVQQPAGVFRLEGYPIARDAIDSEGVQAHDVALALHTSGSTSRPKLVPITHANLCSAARNAAASLQLTAEDRCLNVMPLFHSHGLIGAVLTSLYAGASVVCTPGFYGPDFFGWFQEFHPSWYTAAPTIHRAILDRAQHHREIIGRSRLRFIRSASSALPPQFLEEIERVFGAPVIEAYGMTEAYHMAINPLPPGVRKTGSVGLPAGCEIGIMDDCGVLLAHDEIGEVVVRGPNVIHGYQNNPEANESQFTNGWFRTGDLGRLDRDGYLFITGRSKEIINRGGEKISPREVDEVLMDHPAVAAALTFAIPDAKLGEDIGAVIVLRESASVSEDELYRFASHRLADFKIPRRFVFRDELPKGKTGKPQRIGLAATLGLSAPDQSASLGQQSSIGPRTDIEQRLAAIWQEVLQVEHVGLQDDFSNLGGDSILRTQVIVRLREEFDIEIPMSRLHGSPTIEGLARWIELERKKSGGSSGNLPRISQNEVHLLSFAQQRLWFLDKLISNPSAYNSPMARRIQGPLNLRALGEALSKVMLRHETLRSSFTTNEGVASLKIFETPKLTLRVVSASSDAEAFRLADEEVRQPFDLTGDPLVRVLLISSDPSDHILVLTVHHIVFDGWSRAILLQDLAQAYHAAIAGREPSWAPLEASYADFAAWQRERLVAGEFQTDLDYWKKELRGAPSLLGMPTDMPRPPVMSYRGGTVWGQISSEVRRSLEDIARREECTPFVIMLAAWQALLHRYSQQDDIVVGVPIAGRTHKSVESLVGCFVNTLAIRTRVDGNVSFADHLQVTRKKLLGALDHQDLPFDHLVSELELERDLSRSPLFQAMIVLQDTINAAFAPNGLRVTPILLRNGGSKCDLLLDVESTANGYSVALEYDSSLFRHETAERLLRHFTILLEHACAAPETLVASLPLMDGNEVEQMIALAHGEGASHASHLSCLPREGAATLHELFEAQAARRPKAIALTWEGRALTYGELNAQANRLARYLAKCDITPETPVGLCLERSNDLVMAILAILKAGGAYLPIDLAYPSERLAFILDDARAPLLLTESKLVGRLPALSAKVICVDEVLQRLADVDDSDLPPITGPDHLAYIIYTSGTTGKPKGSMITHRNVVRLFRETEDRFGFNEQDVWTLFHSCAFDFSVWEIWGALVYGGRLVVVPFLVTRSPETFYELLSTERVTVLNQTPSAFRQLIQAEASVSRRELALRYVIFGGEALEMRSLRPWFERHGDEKPQLVNMYGITETTVHVTYRPISRDDLESGSVIGKPIPDLQVYILDAHRQPVPIGVAGELYVGGAGLARGYLGRPELTEERFIPDPFANRPGRRLYRTGDLGRFLPNHDIEYLGRIDEQVKIRGFRIELAEIEAVLCEHEAVREALVLSRDEAAGEKRLVAYLVTHTTTPAVSALREHLKKKLPDYMVPSAFVFIGSFPLTASGKIDRKALPAPSGVRPTLSPPLILPQTPQEKELAAIWSKVLGLEEVGIHDNFFELGGDSILSIQAIALARRQGLKITPKLFFGHQTIAELAAVAEVQEDTRGTGQTATDDVPLTPIQKWFFEQDLDDLHHYNQSFLLEVQQRLDRTLLEGALRELSAHHDALRLRYVHEARGWRQFYSATEEVPLNWLDIEQLTDLDQQERIAELSVSLQSSLNINKGPLWRVAYFDRGANRAGHLLFIVHHLAVDGVSWRPLLEDLETAYWQLQAGEMVDLPAKTTSYKSWAEQLQRLGKETSLQEELPYWRKVCDTSEAPESMVGTPASSTERFARTIKVSLNTEETRALLHQLPSVYNTQINDVLLTAFARAWQKARGTRVLFSNLEGHGRENLFDADLSRTVGWFTSIFPIRLQLPEVPEGWQPGEALKSIKEQLRQIPQHGMAYGILRYLMENTELSKQAEPGVLFNYLGQFGQMLAGSHLFRFAPKSAGALHSPKQRRRHALEVNSLVLGEQLECRWTYSQECYTEREIRQLADEFQIALRELIDHCQSPGAGGRTPSDFPLARLDQPTLDRLLEERHNIEEIYPLSPIQTLFKAVNPDSLQTPFDQWHCTLHGALDVPAFQRAWLETLQRHTILRTTFYEGGICEPLQIVHRQVSPPWLMEDWSGIPFSEYVERWSAFLKQDRIKPLVLSEPPVMRFALVRLDAKTWKFLWSVPALLLDGWSWPLVFRNVSQVYQALVNQKPLRLEPVRPYRDYLQWLDRQPSGQAQQFWKEALAGFREPTELWGEAPASQEDGRGRYLAHTVQLAADKTKVLQQAARNLQVTLNSLFQGAWALLLNHEAETTDVVFGSAFAGRPTDLPGADSIVGPFVNNLPVRVTVDHQIQARSFFRKFHARLLELSLFQFTPLLEIQRCSEISWKYRLFNSLVVFQNYLVDESARNLGEGIEITDFSGAVHSNYPVMLLVQPEASLRVRFVYDSQTVSRSAVERWGRELAALLEAIPDLLEKNVSDLQALLPPRVAKAASRGFQVPQQDFAPPQTEMERIIANVWQMVLGLDRVSIDESFFNLGGHSLALVQMHSELREILKDELPVAALFEFPTIRALARHLRPGTSEVTDGGNTWQDRARRQKQALAQLQNRLQEKV